MSRKGFTLIELLVVISIIGLLASVVLVALNNARAKARDVQTIGQFNQLQKALALYFDKYGKYPNESPILTNLWADNFTSMAQQLVAEGFLSRVPATPTGIRYSYYNYMNKVEGGLLVTTLEAAAPSFGYPGTCRPNTGSNWCRSDLLSTEYCVCNPY